MMLSDAELDRFLAEDVPYGDLTTALLGIGDRAGRMVFRARQPMVVAASEEAARMIVRSGCAVESLQASGSLVEAGSQLLAAHGPASGLLSAWKVSQTLMEMASGIATGARSIVDAARAVSPQVVVACTRKAFPGTRAVAVQAILMGGAVPHRLGLSESILVFPEHRAFLGDETLASALARVKVYSPEKKVVVEVTSIADAQDAAMAGADVIQLEKFTPADVSRTAQVFRERGLTAILAAAGGINARNAAEYAAAGARVLVTTAPYLAPPMDVSVTISAST